jgi:tetratricopeptide (TPR) repeat protein
MKKVLLSMLFASTALLANAQKSEIEAAKKSWMDYANSQNAVQIDLGALASKMKVSGEKKKEEAAKPKPTLAEDLALLNAGFAHTDLAIAHEKSKDLPNAWSIRALIASRIALIDTADIQNSIAKQQVATEAIAKAETLNVKKDKAVETDLKDAKDFVDNALSNRGMIAYKKKDYPTAYTAFSAMTVKNPTDTSMFVNTGLVARLSEKYPEAVANYRKAIDLGFKDSYSLYSQIIDITGTNLKDSAKYLEVLNEASAKYPDSTAFIGRITDYYTKKGDVAKSQEMLKKLAEKDPKNAVYQYYIGETYFKQALTLQEKRNDIDQKKKKEYDDMSAKMMANIDLALPYYKKALELDPKYADAVDKLKSIYGFKSDTPNYEAMSKLLNTLDKK